MIDSLKVAERPEETDLVKMAEVAVERSARASGVGKFSRDKIDVVPLYHGAKKEMKMIKIIIRDGMGWFTGWRV